MSKQPLLDLSAADRRAVYERTEALTGIKAHMAEKDAWVCWTLRQLFELPDARAHFIFKGGTSLSKVWKVIHRFSEDIDISLSREWLGFAGERDPESATGKERKRRLEALAASCAGKLHRDVAPSLRTRFALALGTGQWTLTIDPDDPQTLNFAYPSAFAPEPGAGYVRPLVRIECGARSDRWPVTERTLAPFFAEALPDIFPNTDFSVPVLDIERTFWEKATILHAEAHRPAEKITPERFSRHYADVAALASHAAGTAALARDDLRDRVVEHKQVFFPSAWASYDTAVPGTFKLVPSLERIARLAADYRAMGSRQSNTPLSRRRRNTRHADHGIGQMAQPLQCHVHPATQTATEFARVNPAPRRLQPPPFLFEAAFAGERHLLHLHRVEARETAHRHIGRNRLDAVRAGVQLDFDLGQAGIDYRAKTFLGGLVHGQTVLGAG